MDEWAQVEFRGFWPGLKVISGQRTPLQNQQSGGTPDSRHLRCPSLAVDLRIGGVVGIDAPDVWGVLGGYWKLKGNRWGGDFKWEGSPLPNPREWNHFDLG